MIDNTPTDTPSRSSSISDRDLQKQIEALDRVIEHLQNAANARRKVREGWIPKETFLDELIDVNCTPMGQNTEYGQDAYRNSMREIWYLAGAYLAEAMSSYDDRSRITAPTVNGDGEANEKSNVEKVQGPETGSTDKVDRDLSRGSNQRLRAR